ncbi:MAG TPA: hypothetical protein VFS21_40320 [Roseiflexaceae bacterium]|nr:hypothetical protein [Roseiflexaceae bacterium]
MREAGRSPGLVVSHQLVAVGVAVVPQAGAARGYSGPISAGWH